MGEIERRAGAEPPPLWRFIPTGVGLAISRLILETDAAWFAVPIFLLALLLIPFRRFPKDIDSWKLHEPTKSERRRLWMQLLIPGTVLLFDTAGIGSILPLSTTASTILFGTAFGAAASYSLYRISGINYRTSKELVQRIVDHAALDSVSADDLTAVAHPAAQTLVRGLLAHGAVDGTRVMARQLAKVVEWDIEQVHHVAAPLERRGIVTRSSIMAGSDRGKIFVELSTKGVVLMKELKAGR